ncbi:MAG: TlpA family protein disulfide reductase [Odoribacteraceae bacterium]|jgi:thiol-disulfide isomerase/thioredoxin|nr:TlpA family protein disulfide reductase [Odoribacteraceae bacterium]
MKRHALFPLAAILLVAASVAGQPFVVTPGQAGAGDTLTYPDERAAREREGLRVHLTRDPDEKERAVAAYVKRFFPLKDGTGNDPYARHIVTAALQHNIAREGNGALLLEYLPVVPAAILPELYYRLVQLPWQHRMKEIKELLPLSTAIHDEMKKRAADPAERLVADRPLSPREWEEECTRHNAGFYFTHAELLHHAGEHAAALDIIEPLKERLARGSAFNDLYARLLSANGYRHLLVPFIEASAREDAATPAMLDTLRVFFAREHPGEDFDAYIAALRSPGHVERFEERLVASLVDREITPFALEDTRGERVDIAALKGKVIVLDFWATWCAPCKAALPGMQVAVNRFKEDPRVAFYFISTLEHDPRYKQSVREFIAGKGYEMEVLFDDVDPATGKHGRVYHALSRPLGMNGIPHKAVIDANGRLRWSSSGYHGNPLELANEISFVVNRLLDENK